ncbi:MAG TPA: (2Fe-2S) ferredoxin domain-containing protein [Candidatus Hydrogenedens sp.]|nr:(2Fe-2S) ferredoxin domain-containing protein [Candidatus Hydrogenedens sp.]HOK08236.1 (2Fe-2S) ferredoxin domain-containing protein [Candidatus Hydrogenedens sp.]HOL20008.1 (2Fe-2S) ferredoxin domain-containing protein [Candidatus Hydrogenedens sp.]HPP59173.1 (2Fe-2S) ferredoxin domain-containing protein [Candidatus Hydrogenedens sp.]
MRKQPIPYKKTIFVCTNKKDDNTKPCCGVHKSDEFVVKLKQSIRDKNLKDVIRVSRTGCLGQCEHGPNIMVYPEGIWYSYVKEEDIPFLLDEIMKSLS